MTPVPGWFWPAICACLWAAALTYCWWLATDPRNRKDTPVITPTDELRAAATKLRALLADPQLTAGPWLSLDHGDRLLRNQPGDEDRAPVYVVNEPMSNGANAAWIAAMHPGVGTVLAAWLERVAHGWHSLTAAATAVLDPSNPAHVEPARLLNEGPYDAREALNLARMINATES